jgi:hypothetical protein
VHLALVVPTFAMDLLAEAFHWLLQRLSNIPCVSLTPIAWLLRFGNASCALGSFVSIGAQLTIPIAQLCAISDELPSISLLITSLS